MKIKKCFGIQGTFLESFNNTIVEATVQAGNSTLLIVLLYKHHYLSPLISIRAINRKAVFDMRKILVKS